MDTTWQVGGLPLHPLLVHAVVVLVPLAVVAVVLTQFWPSARRRLGAVTPLLATGTAALVPVTILAGRELKEVVGPVPRVLTHEAYGQALLPWALGLAVVALGQWWWFRAVDRVRSDGGAAGPGGGAARRDAGADRPPGGAARRDAGAARPPGGAARPPAVSWVLAVVVVVVSVGAMVSVVLAGDSGARAVWEGVLG